MSRRALCLYLHPVYLSPSFQCLFLMDVFIQASEIGHQSAICNAETDDQMKRLRLHDSTLSTQFVFCSSRHRGLLIIHYGFFMYCLFFVFLFCLIVDSGGKYLHRFQRSPLRQLLLSLSLKWTEGCINGSKSTFGFVFIYFFSKENSTIISRFFYQFFDRNFLFFQACMTVLHFNFSFTPSVFSAMRVAQYYFAGMAERVIYSLPGQFPAGWSPPLSSLRCNKVLRGGR